MEKKYLPSLTNSTVYRRNLTFPDDEYFPANFFFNSSDLEGQFFWEQY